MLVLTRKAQQQIKIGDNVVVTVLRVKGSSVRIGIEAPDGVRILRGELNARENGRPDGRSTPGRSAAGRSSAATRRPEAPPEENDPGNHPLRAPRCEGRLSPTYAAAT